MQERAGNTLELIGIGNDFLNRTQMAQQLRERIDKWDYMKLKVFCTTKEMVSKLKCLPTEWEKFLPAISKHMKKYSTSLAIKEMQIKTTLRFHLIHARMATNKNTYNNKCW
jgi:hypothetical protein